ncbi:hypothetical protein [Leptospira alstonii]|uniref:Uncharacterized protein n=2 Tax=Leptospira alstonii TaxID=28452 RepID=M6CKN2_9LEPT|nr:hypothetical protein [Leptospira alstonii]EMJ91176.1 hypothetical protein LEP1GSC194_3454 [Leptospira alstonii serovar Sichuan str. 79601]EQA80507.1 hypothetical protein LEP1GSC193_3318 [Leptospira alstonii serovar Pingchang str. 80-412]
MVQKKKKTKARKTTPKKNKNSVNSSVNKNDIRLSDMLDLAAEEFVKTIEIMSKLTSGNRIKLKNSIKAAVKNILED